MKKTAVLALGGNAIIKAGQKGTIIEQFANTRDSLDGIVDGAYGFLFLLPLLTWLTI